MIESVVTNMSTSFATCYDSKFSMFLDLKIVIPTVITCQSICVTELPDLCTPIHAEQKRNSKTS